AGGGGGTITGAEQCGFEGAAGGAFVGGIIGSIVGLLFGIVVRSISWLCSYVGLQSLNETRGSKLPGSP
ncbi:MAG TPA: hypothetical protein VG122_17685, partial [Gemmata sp.]|nr:hypothetical protein [Gemmata sp.]